jgi:hypothetical protein
MKKKIYQHGIINYLCWFESDCFVKYLVTLIIKYISAIYKYKKQQLLCANHKLYSAFHL